MTVILCQTNEQYRHLGDWIAQVQGLPQCRMYGGNKDEALVKLILRFGKEQGLLLEFSTDRIEGAENAVSTDA